MRNFITEQILAIARKILLDQKVAIALGHETRVQLNAALCASAPVHSLYAIRAIQAWRNALDSIENKTYDDQLQHLAYTLWLEGHAAIEVIRHMEGTQDAANELSAIWHTVYGSITSPRTRTTDEQLEQFYDVMKNLRCEVGDGQTNMMLRRAMNVIDFNTPPGALVGMYAKEDGETIGVYLASRGYLTSRTIMKTV